MLMMKNETDPANSEESFSIMKQWLRAKLQLPAFQIGINSKDTENGSALPKIVISRGSENSLPSISNSPVLKKPCQLNRTWLNYNSESESIESTPTMSPLSLTPWIEQRQPQVGGNFKHTRAQSMRQQYSLKSGSYPVTPVANNVTPKYRRAHTTDSCNDKNASPVFRFPARQTLLADLDFTVPTSNAFSSSELDSHSICGACGQRKYFGSQELIGFQLKSSSQESKLALSGTKFQNTSLANVNLWRSSSCRNPGRDSTYTIGKMTKAISNTGIQNTVDGLKRKKIQRTGSKEKSRSTISLTRTLSLNLDPLRIVRTSTLNKDDCYKRKMSLNDIELQRISERRRSSLLQFCFENCEKSDDDATVDGTKTVSSSTDEDLDFSPKVTRSAVFKYDMAKCSTVGSFRSTFAADNIEVPSEYGQVKIMFQFFNDKNELQVTLLKGSNMVRGFKGNLGVFAKLSLTPGKLQKKVCKDKHDTDNPVFYELFCFKVSLDQLLESQLKIKFYNKPGIFSRTKPIGECSIPLYYYDLTAVTVIWQNLRKSKGQKDDLDEFDFSQIEREPVPPRRRTSSLLCGLVARKKNHYRQPRAGSDC